LLWWEEEEEEEREELLLLNICGRRGTLLDRSGGVAGGAWHLKDAAVEGRNKRRSFAVETVQFKKNTKRVRSTWRTMMI
jgi:hypothetical protein